LQHQDGSSHVHAATIPNCRAYDPAFAGELAVIIDHGMREMLEQQNDVFYYVTVMNENYAQPTLPEGVAKKVIRGAYVYQYLSPSATGDIAHVTLMGSGALLPQVMQAAEQLCAQGVGVYVVSVTSWSELARDGQQQTQERSASHHATHGTPYLTRELGQTRGPIIAVSDYVRMVPESVRAYVPEGRQYVTLGTDGFGRSDTRSALRRFFGVDAHAIEQAAQCALAGGAPN
jgi:pyruvate dehydrogenase E1 component